MYNDWQGGGVVDFVGCTTLNHHFLEVTTNLNNLDLEPDLESEETESCLIMSASLSPSAVLQDLGNTKENIIQF